MVVLCVLSLSACGGGQDARKLLQQTFSGTHAIHSGILSFAFTLTPSGSSTLTSPISFSFGGPFQSRGTGKLPASNFNLSLSGLGHTGSLNLLSTGTAGFVSVQGTSYQLPAATFQRLESSFSGITSSGAAGSGSGGLSRLGIDPLHWVTDPKVVGHEHLSGASVTHIRSQVNVRALLADLSTFLQKAATTGASGTASLRQGLQPATQQRIADAVQAPTVDVWTGDSDKTLRRLDLRLNLAVTGQTSTLLGGLRSAALALQMQYGALNQSQTITAPRAVRPFAEFQTKIRSFLATLQGAGSALGAGGAGGTGAAGSTGAGGTSGAGAANSSAASNYSACLRSAGGNVSKMQQCAALLNGK